MYGTLSYACSGDVNAFHHDSYFNDDFKLTDFLFINISSKIY